jgi:hypothetical protein
MRNAKPASMLLAARYRYCIPHFLSKIKNMKTLINILSISTVILLMTSCSDDNKGGTSYLNIKMTDAPGNYSAVNIDLKEIELTGEGRDAVTIDAIPGIYNLIDLSNGVDVLIASSTVESGRLEQIRLILGDNNSVVVDGVTHPLRTPSAQQSGLKLQVHKDLVEGVTYNMLLDFDASASIVQEGNGTYSLKPVIRVIEIASSGSVKGVIEPTGHLVNITASGNGQSFSTYSNSSGQFLLSGVPEGTYSIIFYPPAPLVTRTITDVRVTTGAVTDVGTVNLSGN